MKLVPEKLRALALLASAVLFAFALFWLPWWESSGVGRLDLRSLELCNAEGCFERSLSRAGGSGLWIWSGMAAFSCAAMSAILFGLTGVRQLLRPRFGSKAAWVGAALSFFAALMGLGFVVARPEFSQLSPGYGLASFFSAALLGGSAALSLSREART
jgi:hypothetical protein